MIRTAKRLRGENAPPDIPITLSIIKKATSSSPSASLPKKKKENIHFLFCLSCLSYSLRNAKNGDVKYETRADEICHADQNVLIIVRE